MNQKRNQSLFESVLLQVSIPFFFEYDKMKHIDLESWE
ncbi:hypothetical protein X560_1428 [Listeria fleischmannii 1991]|uniref:Uncharacterized protein n=1 Tax=Listeria fleischmannii 1991 TaxID=1430899 RepID=A0A0J8GET5_9LIST|nr:hypothetical protein X560_1428 [Listeria fleischmannii 1991]